MNNDPAPGEPEKTNPSDLDSLYNALIGQAFLLREKHREAEFLGKFYSEEPNADKETEED